MENKFINEVNRDNADIANKIIEDSKKISVEGIYDENLLLNINNHNGVEHVKKGIRKKKMFAMVSTAAACIVLVLGIGASNLYPLHSIQDTPLNGNDSDDVNKSEASNQMTGYEEIYDRLCKAMDDNIAEYKYDGVFNSMTDGSVIYEENDLVVESVDKESAPESGSSESEGMELYNTNEQTESVHEGDVVKTDGKYIYTLTYNKNDKVIITKVDGKEMENISEIENEYGDFSWEQLYVSGDKLVIVGSYEEEINYGFIREYLLDKQSYSYTNTVVYVYDISDRENPKQLSRNTQEGNVVSTRLSNDILYVVTNHIMHDISVDNCVPKVNDELLSCDCIYLPKYIDGREYTVITSLDINDSDNFMENMAIAASTPELYVSENNIYLIVTGTKEEIVTDFDDKDEFFDRFEEYNGENVELGRGEKAYIEAVYNGVDADKLQAKKDSQIYKFTDTTEIIKYKYDDGKLAFVADTIVDGSVEDNLSFDEEDGYLRFVTTSYTYVEAQTRVGLYIDGENLTNYIDDSYYISSESKETNNVYVLDAKLKEKAHIGNLAEGERIYSARYLGEYGYFVTFEETDPLFSVDFTDMENPQIIGELKIPGFSEYLHFYGDGKLFGFGMEADEDGRTECLKLEMYDISDNNAKQESKYVIEEFDYSEALYNYKAIMVDSKRGLIGFSAEEYRYLDENYCYMLFTYEDNQFKELLRLEYDYYKNNARGFYIGDYLYVVVPSEGIKAVNLITYNADEDVSQLRFN